jgi:iron(III) transport system substrate-binding protein
MKTALTAGAQFTRWRTALHGISGRVFPAALAALAVSVSMQPQSVLAQSAASRAQSADWAKVVEAAKKEGKVALYVHTVPGVNERIRADFAKAYPDITLELNRVIGVALIAKVEEERKSGADGADVVVLTEPAWLEGLAKAGALKVPAGPAAAAWPSSFTLSGAVAVLALEPFVMAYNTNLVKNPPTGYLDLLKPEYKGRVGTTEPVGSPLVAWYEWLEKTQGADYLTKFAAQIPKLYIGSPPLVQATASGEILATIFTIPSAALPLMATGAPMKIVVPKPSFAYSLNGGVLAFARRPNAALVLMDYLMSPRGQTVWNGHGESASPLPNIPGSLDAKSMQLFDSAKYTSEVVKPYTDKWNRVFKAR